MEKLTSVKFPFVVVCLSVLILFNCSDQNNNEEKKQKSLAIDTLDYDKRDYDLMRAYFQSDSLYQSKLMEGIQDGDSHSILLNKVLSTEYESRYEEGISDNFVNILIFSYYNIKQLRDSLDKVSNSLPKIDADSFRIRTDSLVEAIKNQSNDINGLMEED